jgi:Icc-related predicted phosphoesterase
MIHFPDPRSQQCDSGIFIGDNLKILALGDIHYPFQNNSALEWCIEVVRKEKPDLVIQVGDLYDFYAFSKYTRSPSKIKLSTEAELRLGGKKSIERTRKRRWRSFTATTTFVHC